MSGEEDGDGESTPNDASGDARPVRDDASGNDQTTRDDAPGEGTPIEDDTSGDGGGDLAAYEVFVQWQRGRPHEHAETVTASDADLALLLAKRNVDVRSDPVSIMVVPRSATRRTSPDDTTLVPSTDRSYRSVEGYATTDGEDE